jgi:hypothetical protein
MSTYRMFYDDQGNPRASFAEPPAGRGLIALWLQMDIGGNAGWCQELIDQAAAVVQSGQGSVDVTGNLFGVTVTPDRTQIENVYNEDDAVELASSELVAILRDWRELLSARSASA